MPSSLESHSYRSPSTSFSDTHSYKSKSSHAKESEPLTKIPPPRPPREGVTLNAFKKPSTSDLEEKNRLLRDILARDTVIAEMRKTPFAAQMAAEAAAKAAQEQWDYIKSETRLFTQRYTIDYTNWSKKSIKVLQSKRNAFLRSQPATAMRLQCLPVVDQ